MPESTLISSRSDQAEQASIDFYRHVLMQLHAANLPFLVGGAYAFTYYTGISRHSKDFDIFLRRQDYPRASQVLTQAGYEPELTFPHWLAKVHCNDDYVDFIFSSGNGVAVVDDAWFDHAPEAEVLDLRVKLCPAEEMIWTKAFVMERERYDGADVAHLIRACGERLDWPRLLRRFGALWRVLLSHLVLFGLIYQDQRRLIPPAVMEELLERMRYEMHAAPLHADLCGGTLLSREQYLIDMERWGYRDARQQPFGNMAAEDIVHWTDAIQERPNR